MPDRPPRSYDEIVRRTVPNPDSSWRPSREQEAYAKEHALSPEIQGLCGDIHDALLAAGIDTGLLECHVDAEHVVLRGSARDRKASDEIVKIVERVPGVTSVINQLRFEH